MQISILKIKSYEVLLFVSIFPIDLKLITVGNNIKLFIPHLSTESVPLSAVVLPSGQGKQDVWLICVLYVPIGHSSHSPPTFQNDPTGQTVM